MNRRSIGGIVLASVMGIGALLLMVEGLAWARPLGRHCVRVGPLPIVKYCGCTWGRVMFRGKPVANANITLSFGAVTTTTVSGPGGAESYPYYGIEGYDAGLHLDDVATVTAEYNGQTVTRVFRSRPDDTDVDGGQEINLVLPDVGEWLPEPSAGYTLAVKIIGNELWLGGAAGLVHRNLSSTTFIAEDTGLVDGVVAVTTDAIGRVWALGSTAQVAVRDGTTWTTMSTGLTDLQRALVLAGDGSLWAGGDSGLSKYDGVSWQPQPDFNGDLPDVVMALHSASDGSLWAATWEGGVARRAPNGTWFTYTVENSGINGDRVSGLAETSAGIWFALGDYVVPPQQFGGLSAYSPTINEWQTYTQAHGLPMLGARRVAAAPDETVWVSTLGGGVAHSIRNSNPLIFTVYPTTTGLRSELTSQIAVSGPHVFVATLNGVDRFESNVLGVAPVASIVQVSPISVTSGTLLLLDAAGSDPDEGGSILGYEWTSNLDGPVCSLITCTLAEPLTMLRPSTHILRLRVLDDEGMWSSVVTRILVVQGAIAKIEYKVFLPGLVK